jgi:TRAP-type mannitol/chloroaromatic compound transport system permease large subunit
VEIVTASFPFMLMNIAMMATIMIFPDTALWLVRTMH